MLTELSGQELVIRNSSDGQAVDFAGIFERVKKLKEKDKD